MDIVCYRPFYSRVLACRDNSFEHYGIHSGAAVDSTRHSWDIGNGEFPYRFIRNIGLDNRGGRAG